MASCTLPSGAEREAADGQRGRGGEARGHSAITKHVANIAAVIARRDGYELAFDNDVVLDGATDITADVIRACDGQ